MQCGNIILNYFIFYFVVRINKIKYFNSLNLKKNRDNEQVFIADIYLPKYKCTECEKKNDETKIQQPPLIEIIDGNK